MLELLEHLPDAQVQWTSQPLQICRSAISFATMKFAKNLDDIFVFGKKQVLGRNRLTLAAGSDNSSAGGKDDIPNSCPYPFGLRMLLGANGRLATRNF
jgi:hypothetical protein